MGERKIAVDDYALARVPASARYGWFSVAVQRFGQVSALTQFILGATIGYGMTFWQSLLAFTLGAVILEVLAIFVGIIGMREGLSTSVVTRWTGFGTVGSSLIGLAIGVSLVGWFGIQTAVAADSLAAILSFWPSWAWAVFFGLAVTAIVLRGFSSMQWIANLTVPMFLVLVGWAVVVELLNHPLNELVWSPPPGPQLGMVEATTLVAGGFIVGAVITPDMTRFNRSVGDVVKQTLVGVTLGEYVIGMAGVLLAHAVKTADISHIVVSSVGWVGVLIIVLGTFKINDWNLYSSGLGVVNFIDTTFGKKLNRALVTATIGVIGTALAVAGILERFTDFLTILGVAFPPIAGIMVAEYFVVKKFRPELDSAGGSIPDTAPRWVFATIAIWIASSVFGYFVQFGMPSINSVVLAFVLYVLAGKLGLVQGTGVQKIEVNKKGSI